MVDASSQMTAETLVSKAIKTASRMLWPLDEEYVIVDKYILVI